MDKKRRTIPSIGSNKIRIYLEISAVYEQTPVIYELVSNYNLSVNILGAELGSTTTEKGSFDLELQGTSQQISEGLKYLESLNLKIVSRPNPDGDSWYY